MEFMMKNKETLAGIRDSAQCRRMFREIIKSQIQTLIDELAYTGEESVLLTACIGENDVSVVTVGSDLGLEFINREDTMCTFREFCLKRSEEKIPVSIATRSSSHANGTRLGKRSFSEVNGDDNEESSETEHSTPAFEPKRSRLYTPLSKGSGKEESTVESNHTGVNVPKGYSKCSMCNYISKFKANVTRHERGVHRINLEGAPQVTVQYACAVCEYKSTYRSNVMRHEKSLHKMDSTATEIESRKVPLMEIEDDSSVHRIPNEGVETVTSDGKQLFINQTGNHIKTMANQSHVTSDTVCNEHDGLFVKEPVQFDTGIGTQLHQTDNDVNKSDSAADEFDEEDEGCHICNHCRVIFESLSDLRKHIDNTHFTIGNFMCEKCEKSFTTEFSLQIHMSNHSASKQEMCGCGKSFQYRTSLIRHERKCEFWKTIHGSSNQKNECENSTVRNSVEFDGSTPIHNLFQNNIENITRVEIVEEANKPHNQPKSD